MAQDDDNTITFPAGEPVMGSFGFGGAPAAELVTSRTPTTYKSSSRYAPLVTQYAQQYGVDPGLMLRVMQVESGGNPHNTTGSYKGLFQLSNSEFNRFGGGNIYDPADNARAAAAKIAAETNTFRQKYGRDPSGLEIYMQHQQGEGGLAAHLANPNAPAWQSMLSTAEGRQKGAQWAKQAIWGNVPSDMRGKFGSVDNITSQQFVNDIWGKKLGSEFGTGGTGALGVASAAAPPSSVPSVSDKPVGILGNAVAMASPAAPGSSSSPFSGGLLSADPVQSQQQSDPLKAITTGLGLLGSGQDVSKQPELPKPPQLLPDLQTGLTQQQTALLKAFQQIQPLQVQPLSTPQMPQGLAMARAAALRGQIG